MRKYYLVFLVIVFAIVLLFIFNEKKMKQIEIGDMVPIFTLLNEMGEPVTIGEKMVKPLVIFFYPKDNTPGCTKEVCKFRDEFSVLSDFGAEIFGISSDAVESHKKFKEKYQLPYSLLSDPNNEIRSLFGVPKSMVFFPGRVTFIIDQNGVVKFIFNNMFDAEKHVEMAIQQLKKM